MNGFECASHLLQNRNVFTIHKIYFSHLPRQSIDLQSQYKCTPSESIPSESAALTQNNANHNELNRSSDSQSELELDDECSSKPINTGFTKPGMIKDDHKIYGQSHYENM